MRQDRFEQWLDEYLLPDFTVDKYSVLRLLRRQHAAYVRMVKHYLRQEQTGLNKPDFIQACEMILEDFARYKAGRKP